MAEMIQELSINSNIENVYNALVEQDKLSKWWTNNVKAKPSIGSIAEFSFMGGQVIFKMEVTDLKSPKSVQWKCVGGPPEWPETNVSFTLRKQDNNTILRFEHGNWTVTDKSFGAINYQWAQYLKSLKDYVETGKGSPNTT